MTVSAKLQGLSFAGKVAEAKDPWGSFSDLRNDFLKLDGDGARLAAIDVLVNSGDATMRSFANALEAASGMKRPTHADAYAQRVFSAPSRSSGSESTKPTPDTEPLTRHSIGSG